MATTIPTDGELAILGVLWAAGPSTVRSVHEVVARDSKTAYTTTLKLMQIMHDKGLVRRDASQRSHVYDAVVKRGDVQAKLLSDLAAKAFGGSAAQMAMRALSLKQAAPEELAALRALLDDLEAK